MRSALIVLFATAVLCGSVLGQTIAIRNADVYVSPEHQIQRHVTILVQDGKISAVGTKVRVLAGTPVLPCNHCVVFSGFWNTHVHFTGPQWEGAAHRPAAELTSDMQAMLTHSGFTTVVDLSSEPVNTTALRRRVESGEVAGPKIYTAGFGLYPPNGIPYYLEDLPSSLRALLPQPSTSAEARAAVQRNLKYGTDVVKLFTGSYLTKEKVVHMPVQVAMAAVSVGHRHGQLVFAHPSDLEGVEIAIESGVDVLAHAPNTFDKVDESLIRSLVVHHMAMTPTLKLFSGGNNIGSIREVVARFHAESGTLLFGTDTGFLSDYDVTEEYHQLALAGLSFRDILAMLTTNPAAKFKVSARTGSIAVGSDGDLTVVAENPAAGDLRAFAHVLYTIRAGRVIFDARTD
jgi:imidazolonepropionase-like amidohydrolase